MANTHLEFPPSQFIHHPHEFYRKSKCEQGENEPPCPNTKALEAHNPIFIIICSLTPDHFKFVKCDFYGGRGH